MKTIVVPLSVGKWYRFFVKAGRNRRFPLNPKTLFKGCDKLIIEEVRGAKDGRN